jgi:hypothetical protein
MQKKKEKNIGMEGLTRILWCATAPGMSEELSATPNIAGFIENEAWVWRGTFRGVRHVVENNKDLWLMKLDSNV